MRVARRIPYPFGLFLALGLLFLAGCTAVKQEAELPFAAQAALERARLLESNNDYHGAAQAYLALAETLPRPDRYQYQTRAAELLAAQGNTAGASELLDLLESQRDLPDALRFRLVLTRARIALAEDHATETLRLLQQPPGNLDSSLQAQVFELRAAAYARLGNPLESVQQRLLLEPFLSDAAALQANHAAIWQTLSTLPEDTLAQLVMTTPPGEFGGWLELADIMRTPQEQATELALRLSEWRERYRGHPAESMIGMILAERESAFFRQPADIALLLPLTGRYADAAAAVRDGFLAAYYAQRIPPRPAIRIYDTGGNPARTWALYQQAVSDGVRLVVGPLDKEGLEALMQTAQLAVPVLALNSVESGGLVIPNLYQFGLLPEDETFQLAARARTDGHRRAIALVPTGPWGERMANGFRTSWERLGGTLVEVQSYDPAESDHALPIRALLDLDKAEARHRDLQALLKRRINFEPRRRQDVDFVFLAAFPAQARLIQPQLRYHHALDLPIYATSHVYTGTPDSLADQDLEGIMFCDIPWLLSDDGGPTSHQFLQQLWPDAVQRYPRLYALGMDAYNVAPYLADLRDNPQESYNGATGALSLDPANRVRRELPWARFVRGQPRLMAASPAAQIAGSER